MLKCARWYLIFNWIGGFTEIYNLSTIIIIIYILPTCKVFLTWKFNGLYWERKMRESIDSLALCWLSITGNDFHFVDLREFLYFSKFDTSQHKSPDIVTEAVGFQIIALECHPCLHPCCERVIDNSIKLKHHLVSQFSTYLSHNYEFIKSLLQSISQCCIPIQLVSHG